MELILYETNEEGINLMVSIPFGDFDPDCEHCKHFRFDRWMGGGKCKKHGFGCGFGFTCNDFEIKIKKDLQKIK